MWGETPAGQTGSLAQPVEAVAQPTDAERTAEVVEEDLDRWRLLVGKTRSTRTGRPSVRYASRACLAGTAEKADPLFAALAHDPDLAAPEIER